MNNELQQFGESAVVNPEGLKVLEQSHENFSVPTGWIFVIALIIAAIFSATAVIKKENKKAGGESADNSK